MTTCLPMERLILKQALKSERRGELSHAEVTSQGLALGGHGVLDIMKATTVDWRSSNAIPLNLTQGRDVCTYISQHTNVEKANGFYVVPSSKSSI